MSRTRRDTRYANLNARNFRNERATMRAEMRALDELREYGVRYRDRVGARGRTKVLPHSWTDVTPSAYWEVWNPEKWSRHLRIVDVEGGCYVVACRRSCRPFRVPVRDRAWAECPECGARAVLRSPRRNGDP